MSSSPIPIAFCITDLDPGGAERCLAQVVTGLNRDAWRPAVFCLGRAGELAGVIESAGIDVTCLGARSPLNLAVIPRLARRLRELRPQLLQTFLFHANLAGRLAGRMAGIPVIVSGIRVAEREKHWHVRADRWTRRLVDHTVCVSRAVADFSNHAARLRPERVSVIPNGVDYARFAEAVPADLSHYGVPAGVRMILSVGRLHPQKGHRLLIEALAPLLQREEDLHLIIAGEGPLRAELMQEIARLPSGSRIHLIGAQEDIPGLMRAANLFVLTSRWEGMPNVVLEAMAAGTPVVTTDVEGVRELIADGESGLIVNSFCPKEIRTAVERCLADSGLRSRMAESAQQYVKQSFTTQLMIQKYDELYRRLLAESEH